MAQKNPILLKKTGEIVQTLCIYGACGIVTFGWGLSRLLHFGCKTYAPLWFCAAIFIYNLDRLKTDPADPINTPRRSREAAKLRKASIIAAAARPWRWWLSRCGRATGSWRRWPSAAAFSARTIPSRRWVSASRMCRLLKHFLLQPSSPRRCWSRPSCSSGRKTPPCITPPPWRGPGVF